jgi:hypothetical protein
MTELSPRARALFEAGRRSHQPTDQDRERNLLALSQRVSGFVPKHEDSRGPIARSGLGAPGITAIVVGLVVAGAGVFQLARPEMKESAPAATPSAVMATTLPLPAALPDFKPVDAPATASASAPTDLVAAPRGISRPIAATSASDRLAEEVAILSQAEHDLRAGSYQGALRLLNEHRRRFPKGILAQERVAARVQALCGLGRVSEAQAELARLSASSLHGAAEACTRNR